MGFTDFSVTSVTLAALIGFLIETNSMKCALTTKARNSHLLYTGHPVYLRDNV